MRSGLASAFNGVVGDDLQAAEWGNGLVVSVAVAQV
jgi:hypothetical protein